MEKSNLLRAAEVLLVIGPVLQLCAAALVLLLWFAYGPWMVAFVAFLAYPAVALLAVAGAIVGFQANARADRGDLRGAFRRSLLSAMLPPVQLLTLIGAILFRICPEAKGPSGAPEGPH